MNQPTADDNSSPDEAGAKPPADPIAYGRIGIQLAILAVVLAVGGGVVGYLAAGFEGLWGALLGAATVGLFFGASALVMHLSKTPESKARNLLLSWFGKLVVLFGLMLVLNQASFINRPAFGLTVVVGVMGSLAVEGRVVWAARVTPEPGPDRR
ncbi:MAG: hypothetical protein LBJ02_04185 [Bifidobacteriaceae bacterium]|jgi:hypothetical protein|nr:hypothetical protein [Bifidobacteriaceae bacterium]